MSDSDFTRNAPKPVSNSNGSEELYDAGKWPAARELDQYVGSGGTGASEHCSVPVSGPGFAGADQHTCQDTTVESVGGERPQRQAFGGRDAKDAKLVRLLGRVLALKPGDELLGEPRVHPDVSAANARLIDDLYNKQVPVEQWPHLSDIARHLGVPHLVPRTISERELTEAKAVLCAAIHGQKHASWEFYGRRQGTPVNVTSLDRIRKMVGSAEAVKGIYDAK